MDRNRDWQAFYEQTKERPPSPLLVKALAFTSGAKKAIDIGGGALKDSKYLLKLGFDVTDLDNQPLPPALMEEVSGEAFHYIRMSYADFEFPKNEYDVVNASYALPFNPPVSFDRVFSDMVKSLKTEGIFCGQLFGIQDDWNGQTDMTFHTRDQVEALLASLKTLHLEEYQRDNVLASGIMKHWHVFDIIAQKPS